MVLAKADAEYSSDLEDRVERLIQSRSVSLHRIESLRHLMDNFKEHMEPNIHEFLTKEIDSIFYDIASMKGSK